jgi:phospholipid/cholesterol/gamma-HCH transport system substrate-binding protein
LRQLVNSLQRLNTSLSHNQGQIVRLVDASSTVFRAFASQDSNISAAVRDLPGTLAQTTDTLNKVTTFADLLGPTAKNLLPAAKALPAANAAVTALAKPSAPIVQNQIRPFVVAARPLVRNLKPAAQNLAAATPNLTKTFNVVNHLGNMLGYNPGNTEHGYLWWLAWLDHNVRTLFATQDANGDFRPLFLQASCATYAQLVDQVGASAGGQGAALENLLNLTPILTSAGVCPTQAAANQADFQKYQTQKQSLASTASGTVSSSANAVVGGTAKALAPFDPKLPVK